MPSARNYPLSSYGDPASGAPVFRLRATPDFSPLEVNVAFLARTGWNQSVDRLRLHFHAPSDVAPEHPLAQAISRFEQHLLIRRLDRDEDCFASVHVSFNGEVGVLGVPPENWSSNYESPPVG